MTERRKRSAPVPPSPTRGKTRRSEDHFRQLVEGVEEYAILLLDPEGRILTWNAGAATATGYSAAEALGQLSQRFYSPEAIAEGIPARHLAQAAASGHLTDAGWCVRKDGTRFWTGLTITAVTGDGGVPRCYLIIARDLTQRRELEQRLREAAEAARSEAAARLRESEERFARFAQHLPGLAWIKDLAGRYVYINDAGAEAFDRPREEVYGLTDRDLFPPEIAAQFRENDQRALQQGRGIEVVEQMTFPDGETHHSIVSKFPILDPQGEVRWVGGIAIDITPRVRAEAALRQADRRKDEFLATLSHELRNPLAPLRNSLHLLRTSPDAETEPIYAMMDRQLSRLVRLVDDLLEVSRIAGGKIQLRREPVSLATVIEGAVETSRPLIEAAGHQLTVELAADPLIVDVDPLRMAQVLSNLLNNAAKYTLDGGRLAIVARREGSEAVVTVRDNGLGIPAEMLPRVFDMFAQVDRTLKRSQGGLGIGLALARSLVELHRGSIEARSAGLQQGSEFVVRIPLSSHPGAQLAAPERGGSERVAPQRVLVVDDSRDGADSLAQILGLMGADAQVAYDGPSALAAIREHPPAVVLLDLGMPGMDGFEVAAEIRTDPGLAKVRLVALTGYGSEDERRRSREVGFDDHCIKPVDPARLRALLARGEEIAST